MESRICHFGWKRIFFRPLTGVFLCCGLLFSAPVFATSIFINEFHYDNAGRDTGEGIEIAGPAGTDLTGWSLVLYNGGANDVYQTLDLSDAVANVENGFAFFVFAAAGLQNGNRDGLALVAKDAAVVQFLSYEGIMTAANGPAAGLTSTDIGRSESSVTPIGFSLQLVGTGHLAEDFSWADAKSSSFGGINSGQTFVTQPPIPTPEPGTLALFSVAATALVLLRKRITN